MRLSPLFATALAFALLAGRAIADDASEREARALFAEGKSFVATSDYAAALDRFQRAYAYWPNVKLLLNIATMYRELGRSVEAANAYQRYLGDPAADPAKKAEVEAVLATLDARLALLRIQAASPEVTVRLDGRLEGEPGEFLLVRVEPGSHVLTAERGGGTVVTEILTVGAGDARQVVLRPPVAVGAAPPKTLSQVQPVQPPTADRVDRSSPSLRADIHGTVPAWAWIAGGAGVALGVVAVAFRVDWGNVDAKQAKEGCSEGLCPRSYLTLDADNARKDRDRALFLSLVPVGIVGIGASVVGIVIGALKKDASRAASIDATPWLGYNVTGMVIKGSY